MRALIATACTALALAACSAQTQYTSGDAYLARSTAPVAEAETLTRTVATAKGEAVTESYRVASTDELVRRAASIEPTLVLPARIGLARIEAGALTAIPPHEATLWREVAVRQPGLGTTVAIDPFLAELTARTVMPQDRRLRRQDADDIITRIRLGAARQHVDAVLVYEVGTARPGRGDIEGLHPVRILGGALAPAAVGHEGVARALLLDVRNGYPYATLSASADLDGAKPDFWVDDAEDKAYAEATTRIVRALGAETDRVFGEIARAAALKVAAK